MVEAIFVNPVAKPLYVKFSCVFYCFHFVQLKTFRVSLTGVLRNCYMMTPAHLKYKFDELYLGIIAGSRSEVPFLGRAFHSEDER